MTPSSNGDLRQYKEQLESLQPGEVAETMADLVIERDDLRGALGTLIQAVDQYFTSTHMNGVELIKTLSSAKRTLRKYQDQ